MSAKYLIVPSAVSGYFIVVDPSGYLLRRLTRNFGQVVSPPRRFRSRAGARKAITRQKRGDFHR
jgi:hypothetical protein